MNIISCALRSIRKYSEPNSYEIIVVDNHSTDETAEWLKGQPDIKLILNSDNVGFPAGCNQGIAEANGNSILLLNNDTIVTPNWLSNLNKCLFSAADIGAVGTITNSCSNFQSIECDYSSIEEMIEFARQINHSNPEQWENRGRLVGYCMLIKAEVISKIGLLDEVFSPGNYEDDDYSLRIRNAGYRLVLCRDTFIHHFGSVSFDSFGECTEKFNALLETSKQKFINKWGIYPHSIVPSDHIQDPALTKWFTYQHDYNYYRQLTEHARNKFYLLLSQAEFAVLSGDNEKAMLLVKKSADYAHHRHPGFFASSRLELILRKIAEKLIVQGAQACTNQRNKSTGKQKMLHVLSQGYDSGGHTKVLERWMVMDTQAIHSVMVTLNSDTNPQWLITAATQSGGWYQTLDTENLTLYQRAKVLREKAFAWSDVVVLHIHPHDPIPAVAFGVHGGPPVVFLNHAGHAFTAGMSVADLIVEQRGYRQFMTRSRHSNAKCIQLPIPIETPNHLADKQISKTNLGLSEDSVVF